MLIYEKCKTWFLAVCKVIILEGFNNHPTAYILSPTTKGLFVVILQDKNDGRIHTVKINSGLKIIYNCMKNHELIHNIHNFNKCCGSGNFFQILLYKKSSKIKWYMPRNHGWEQPLYRLFLIYITGHIISSHTYNKLHRRG